MDKNVFVTRFGELMVTVCEMQDVINRLMAENAELLTALESSAPSDSAEQPTEEAPRRPRA
jgi:hypothetical protein